MYLTGRALSLGGGRNCDNFPSFQPDDLLFFFGVFDRFDRFGVKTVGAVPADSWRLL